MSLFEKALTGTILGVVGAGVVGACMNLENLENDLRILNFKVDEILNPITEKAGAVSEFFQIVADDTEGKMGIALSNFSHEMEVGAGNAGIITLFFGLLIIPAFYIIVHRHHNHLEAQQEK